MPALVASALIATVGAFFWVCFDICRWLWRREDVFGANVHLSRDKN